MAKLRGTISENLPPQAKLQVAVQEWLIVTYEFNEWRHQLNKVMTAYNPSATDGLYVGNLIAIANINTVYLELIEALEKLLRDVEQMEERGGLNLDQLVEHTKTIRQWSQKIRDVLSAHAPKVA